MRYLSVPPQFCRLFLTPPRTTVVVLELWGNTAVPEASDGLTKLRYLVSVIVAGLGLGFVLSTQLDGILRGLGIPIGVAAAIVLGFPIALFMRSKGWRTLFHAIAAGALLGLLPWGLLAGLTSLQETFELIATGVGTAIAAWLVLKAQTLPLRFVAPKAVVLVTIVLGAFAIGLGIAGTCGANVLIYGPPASAEGMTTIAAFEVPLSSEPERKELLALLQREATEQGLHVDAISAAELQQTAAAVPEAAATIDAEIYRGTKDNRHEAGASDRFHPGLVWITFSRGEEPALASRFRTRTMQSIRKRWPETRSLPLIDGTIPPHDAMVRTSDGYRLKASAAPQYRLSESSPLVAQDTLSRGEKP